MVVLKIKRPTMPTYSMWYNYSASSQMLPLHEHSAIMRNVGADCIKIAFYNCQFKPGLGNSFNTSHTL